MNIGFIGLGVMGRPMAGHLIDAGHTLTLNRVTGVTMEVNAPSALLDSTREIVTITDIAYVEDSSGTSGTIYDSVFDYASQTLVGEGAVHIDYADGTTLDGVGMTLEARAAARHQQQPPALQRFSQGILGNTIDDCKRCLSS